MKITVQDRQCLLDIGLEITGAMEGAMRLALRNGLPLTAELAAGQILEYEAEDIVDAQIAGVYALERIVPATDLAADIQDTLLQSGIGFMGIEFDFLVR